MIDLGFDNGGDLITVSTDGAWFASYFLHGDYELSTGYAPGIYQVINEGGTGWNTTIDYPSPLSNVLTSQAGVLAFDKIATVATPEPSTFVMLAMGLACIVFVRKYRRAACPAQTDDWYDENHS